MLTLRSNALQLVLGLKKLRFVLCVLKLRYFWKINSKFAAQNFFFIPLSCRTVTVIVLLTEFEAL